MIGRQTEFKYNAIDDLEVLENSPYFVENIDKLYTLDQNTHEEISRGSMKNKVPLVIDREDNQLLNEDVMDLVSLESLEQDADTEPQGTQFAEVSIGNVETLEDVTKLEEMSDSGSSGYCSSRSSVTRSSSSEEEDGSSNNSEDTDESDFDEEDEKPMMINLKNCSTHAAKKSVRQH